MECTIRTKNEVHRNDRDQNPEQQVEDNSPDEVRIVEEAAGVSGLENLAGPLPCRQTL